MLAVASFFGLFHCACSPAITHNVCGIPVGTDSSCVNETSRSLHESRHQREKTVRRFPESLRLRYKEKHSLMTLFLIDGQLIST